MYIANTYIGNIYTPGEVISDELPADTLKWLIKSGAIREGAPDPASVAEAEKAENAPTGALAEDKTENEVETEDNILADDSGTKTEAEDEIDEEAEAPEIDIMDGIVASAPAKSGKTAQTARKAAGKTSERSKTK